jgi:hypothetical protein
MTDSQSESSSSAGGEKPDDGNESVYYSETLAMSESENAGRLMGWLRKSIPVLVLLTLVAVVLVGFSILQQFAASLGGTSGLMNLANNILGDGIVVVGAFVLGGIVMLLISGAMVRSLIRNVRGALETEVGVQVSDNGVRVIRSGAQSWQSSGVDIPFDAITAIEIVDPEESSFRMEMSDGRAPKFLAGRSKQWVRVERDPGKTVYIGSDRPQELAETIAAQVPGNVPATPY